MGYEIVTLTVSGRVSRHNSSRDNTDNVLWNEFADAVVKLANNKKYKGVVMDVMGADRFQGYPEYEDIEIPPLVAFKSTCERRPKCGCGVECEVHWESMLGRR